MFHKFSPEQTCTVVIEVLKYTRDSIIINGIKISFTFSAGIADSTEYERSRLSSEVIIENADNRLYMAKESGRNRIVISDLSIADELQ